MHVRVTKRRRGDKVYRSVQLVESYRRRDGMPAHRVMVSLGNLTELETNNLKHAVSASRRGEAVMVPSAIAQTLPLRVRRNLSYLDVAVCYRTWNAWQLSELIDELAPTKRRISHGEVIGALTVQRCVEPASKLEASRWYPRTVLPELQGIAAGKFNNTRVHRALDALSEIEEPLQERLAVRIEDRQGRFVCLFLDCTDTWFVGRGPELAHMRTTKEGLARRRIGIALMCNREGLPLRWKTLAGNHDEAKTMMSMVDQAISASWAEGMPLVVDRAMGRGVTVEGLLARDALFVTAVPCHEIASYSARVPLGAFDEVDVADAVRSESRVLTELGNKALEAGFTKVSPSRYVLDLETFTKGEQISPQHASWLSPSRSRAILQLALLAREELDSGMASADVAERYQSSERELRRWMPLLDLNAEIQRRILAEEADRIPVKALQAVAQMPVERQREAFEKERERHSGRNPIRVTQKMADLLSVPFLKVRGVVVFNPERFIEQRRAADKAVAELDKACDVINRRLRSRRSRRTREQAIAKMYAALRNRSMMDLFDVDAVDVELDGQRVPQLRLLRKEDAWKRRRQIHGLSLIVAHPQLPRSGEELVQLYFAKDQVEKDFQAIKSVLALRPVNHQTDPKVRAHVSLCMLALLIERLIEQKLRTEKLPMTAEAALHHLRSCHLNLFSGDPPAYAPTEADPEQRRILAALEMEGLIDDDAVTESLTPR